MKLPDYATFPLFLNMQQKASFHSIIVIICNCVSRFYLGTGDERPGERHLYVAPDPGLSAATNDLGSSMEMRRLEPRCLTCGLDRKNYDNCTYFSASVSPETGYVMVVCLGPGIPRAGLHQPLTSLRDKFKMIALLYEGYHQKISAGASNSNFSYLSMPHFYFSINNYNWVSCKLN
jgi:hypothetical protein